MSRIAPALGAAVAFVVALAVLALTDGDARVWVFRSLVVVVGIAAARALVVWHADHPRPPEPFQRRRRRRRRRSRPAPTSATERALHLATVSAGDTHRLLRPLVQAIADERLRASRGVAIDDARASAYLAPATWDLVRPDRPAPHDLRARGLTPTAIEAMVSDLESL